MAERTGKLLRSNGTITLGALAGGAFSLTTGAADGSAETYTVAFEAGDFNVTVQPVSADARLDRDEMVGWTAGAEQAYQWTFSADLRDYGDATVATLAAIGLWAARRSDKVATYPGSGDYVPTNWVSDQSTAIACSGLNLLGLTYVNTCGGVSETQVIQGGRVTAFAVDPDSGTLTISGEVLPKYYAQF